MATKNNSAGLFSKVVRFVRNPTKDWSELDQAEPEPESGNDYDKSILKEMIERKRQNDFVRQREFDQLRKLRRNVNLTDSEQAGRPSFFQGSNTSNLDERALTLRKIDEIEAQMSRQWWKSKNDQTLFQEGGFPITAEKHNAGDGAEPQSAAPGSSANIFPFAATVESSPKTEAGQSRSYEPTQMGQVAAEDLASIGTARQMNGPAGAGGRNLAGSPGQFSAARLPSVELSDSLADPDLEEAAIRFANGDDKGAEATLLAALQADKVDPASAAGWAAALFDFYRSTEQQSGFDRFVIDYAQRFGRAAPPWFSTPDSLKSPLSAAERLQPADPSRASASHWDCPAELDLLDVQALSASQARVAPGLPWRLNWSRLNTITADAAQALAQLFAHWCTQTVSLHFDGADVLDKTLREFTPSGQKQVAPFWWKLRLDALRLLRRHDEFELAALDFCVTYEVAPPPWSDPRCDYADERMTAPAPPADNLRSFDDTALADFGQALTVPAGLDVLTAAELELVGELLGDATPALDKFKTEWQSAKRIVISCERLIRVDFSAAGSLLNWVAARGAEGCVVQFRAVSLLVAAFFNVIGINEHARVGLRNN